VIRLLLWLISFLMLASVSLSAERTSDSINWLLHPVPDNAKGELRVISIDAQGKRLIANIQLSYLRRQGIRMLTLAIRQRGQPDSSFCFQTDAIEGAVPCSMKAFPRLESTDEFIPGTMLPWHVLLERFFLRFEVSGMEVTPDGLHNVFELIPVGQASPRLKFKLRVHASRENDLPEKISYVNNLGQIIYTIQIHEIHRTGTLLSIMSSSYHDLKSGVRVLIEMRPSIANGAEEMRR